jgi:hypothetical protein
MYEAFIKEWLLSNQSRVYSVIVETYHQKLKDLKPTLFRKWLALEIGVPEEKINLSSLNSAMLRQRKREEKGKSKGKNNSSAIHTADNADPKDNFTFSSAENVTSRKRTTEL